MLAWENSGLSRDAAVRVAAHDRAGLERLLRYCARVLHVRFVQHCCRWQPKGRCLFMADCCRLRARRGASAYKRRPAVHWRAAQVSSKTKSTSSADTEVVRLLGRLAGRFARGLLLCDWSAPRVSSPLSRSWPTRLAGSTAAALVALCATVATGVRLLARTVACAALTMRRVPASNRDAGNWSQPPPQMPQTEVLGQCVTVGQGGTWPEPLLTLRAGYIGYNGFNAGEGAPRNQSRNVREVDCGDVGRALRH